MNAVKIRRMEPSSPQQKAERIGWSGRYQGALRRYLGKGVAASVRPAQSLGRQAVVLGLETIDMAPIHARAVMTLVPAGGLSKTRQAVIKRANVFFAETMVPNEKTHRAALDSDARVLQLTRMLRQRTVESSDSKRRLERGITRRQVAETALKKSGKHRAGLLLESNRLQNRLRHQAHSMLSAQEVSRHKNSVNLNDEIAQTLLAINIRLLSLKTSAMASREKFEKDVVETQQMVQQSVMTIRRLVRRFGGYHEE